MGVLSNKEGTVFIHGNFVPIRKKRPKNWIDKEYKIMVPYPFKCRATLGKATCDCVQVLECYQPWYGFSFYHSEDCAIEKHLKRYPGITNLLNPEYDPSLITRSE